MGNKYNAIKNSARKYVASALVAGALTLGTYGTARASEPQDVNRVYEPSKIEQTTEQESEENSDLLFFLTCAAACSGGVYQMIRNKRKR